MKLTVGPLPPAVYWRRRAVLAAALLTLVLLVSYACSRDSGADDGRGGGGPGAGHGASRGPGSSGSAAPSVLLPPSGEPTAPVGGAPAGPGSGASGAGGPDAAAPSAPHCGDSELTVVPVTESPTVRLGVPTKLTIKIKNISGRTCARDVGAQMQELYLQQGTTRQWSSDACDKRSVGNELRTFPPDHERSYSLSWDGRSSAHDCTKWLEKGTYQLYGRLGTKTSEPVTITVTG